ncbi:MAG TPA: hypothetical protein VGK59_15155 [Ohtaekwangia sp.]
MKNTYTILLLILTLATGAVQAQGVVQAGNVVSRNISKTIALQTSDVLSIKGEKAYIRLTGWDKPHAALKITFSAEHPDKAVAQAELEYIHYSLSREKNIVELQNAFLLPSRIDRIQSRVNVSFELMVPRKATLSVYNRYGDTEIRDVSGTLSLNLEFSDLLLDHVSGKINVRSSYSDIRGQALSPASFTSDDEESKYVLTLDNGSYRFNSRHSDLDLTLGNIQSLSVNAAHTDITIQPANYLLYNYQLVSREGKIFVPRQLNAVIKENNQSRFVLTHAPANPLIDIKTTFNTITLQ